MLQSSPLEQLEQLKTLCRALRPGINRASMEQKARYAELVEQVRELEELLHTSGEPLNSARLDELYAHVERFSRYLEPVSVPAA